ncbi:vesicle-associated membrane protein 3-like isoform X2 [Chiloscyllium plagiosum]|uniref:vesicle-associated membrane protein 3-like isoform X2 n=1 Tax=Chiloscyllium plagiosum TaxID=36176 RepID=UPI001CB7B10F|nr:vesicle-associated membrane protein 3-like isoform X2 [Chiloscyllium plagiosum]
MGTNNSEIARLQQQADEVVEVMYANVKKVKEREDKLQVLDERAEQLQEAGKLFQKTSKQVAIQEASRNRKWKIILGVAVGLVILVVVIVVIIITTSLKDQRLPHQSEAVPKLETTTAGQQGT